MIKIQELRKQDYKKARQFAIQGMHLHWYVSNKIILNLYARYFLDMELSCATRAYGAYAEDQFVGILLADMKDEPKKYHSIWRKAYVGFLDWLQHLVAGDGVEAYDKANQEMFRAFCEKGTPGICQRRRTAGHVEAGKKGSAADLFPLCKETGKMK